MAVVQVGVQAVRGVLPESLPKWAEKSPLIPKCLLKFPITDVSNPVSVPYLLSVLAVRPKLMRPLLASPSADGVGKRLGFLLQELLREANTTGSKANDGGILQDVISIKEELERIREQVENLE